MDGRALREWRMQLGFTQEEAAKHLDVTRATIQNWEYGITSLPGAIHFACQECVRRWKQRPDAVPYFDFEPQSVFGSIHMTCLSPLVTDRVMEAWYDLSIA